MGWKHTRFKLYLLVSDQLYPFVVVQYVAVQKGEPIRSSFVDHSITIFYLFKNILMIWIYIFITLLTFCIMEGITWLTHKYIMHGFLWYFHEDHHQPAGTIFEKNDIFFLIFAIPSWLCIMLGSMHQQYYAVSIGAGIAMYGAAYFLVHEIIIHQRFKLFTRSNNRYIKAIRWAHKMHHKHLDKQEGESFGMLLVAKKYWDKVRRDEELQKSIA